MKLWCHVLFLIGLTLYYRLRKYINLTTNTRDRKCTASIVPVERDFRVQKKRWRKTICEEWYVQIQCS